VPILSHPNARSETVVRAPIVWPRVTAVLAAVAVVVLPLVTGPMLSAPNAMTMDEMDAAADAQEQARARADAAS
jgi:hypothetical protein